MFSIRYENNVVYIITKGLLSQVYNSIDRIYTATNEFAENLLLQALLRALYTVLPNKNMRSMQLQTTMRPAIFKVEKE